MEVAGHFGKQNKDRIASKPQISPTCEGLVEMAVFRS